MAIIIMGGSLLSAAPGIARLPFSDGFEDGTLNAWDIVGGTVDVSSTEAYMGTRSASTLAVSGQQSDNWLEFNFGDALQVGGTPTGLNDLWIQFAHKWASDYADSGINAQKLLLLNMHNPTSGARRYQMTFNYWQPTDGYFCEFLAWLESGGFSHTVRPNIGVELPRVKGIWQEFVFRVRMNTPGNPDGHLEAWTKNQGDTAYVQRVSRTDINFREASGFTPNRFIGLSNYDTTTTRTGRRYWDSHYIGQTPVDLSPSGNNDGLIVTNYTNYDPDAASIISLEVNNTIPNWGTTGGASIDFANRPWWNGSSVPTARMYPPTVDERGSGFGALPFWKNATKVVRQINFRMEYLVSANYCGDSVQHPKFILFRTARELSTAEGVTIDRPMFFLENLDLPPGAFPEQDNSLFFVGAQGTSRMFSRTNLVPGPVSADWVSGDPGPTTNPIQQDFYHRATGGTDSDGGIFIPASEVVCVECRINVMSTTDEPNGIIAWRMYRRNGFMSERGLAWTWDPNHVLNTNFIQDIDTFGGGYYNNANVNPIGNGLYTEVGRVLTIGFNLAPTVGRHWMGPPTGFVTG